MKKVNHPIPGYKGFVFFWGTTDYMSNWYPCQFRDVNLTWYNSEQYFIYLKAAIHNDQRAMQAAIDQRDPKQVKAIGRTVSPFDEQLWVTTREEAMYTANLPKYAQNPLLGQMLIDTEGYRIVEASPVDNVWGIGLAERDQNATRPENWRGLNLLGNCLERVRAELTE